MEQSGKPSASVAKIGGFFQKLFAGKQTEANAQSTKPDIKTDGKPEAEPQINADATASARISANRLNAMKTTSTSDQWDKIKARAAGEAAPETDWLHKEASSSKQNLKSMVASEIAEPVKRRTNARMTQAKLTNTRLKALVETMEKKETNPIDQVNHSEE